MADIDVLGVRPERISHRRLACRLGAAMAAALLTTAGIPGGLSAQQDTIHLTLDSVLARVSREHPVTRAGAAGVAAARARAADLRAYPNPTFDVERTTLAQADNVALMQSIRWPWEGTALRDVGRADVAAAQADARGARADVLLDAAQRFADVLRDGRTVALAAQAESLAQRALDRTRTARSLGLTGDLSVLQAEVGLDAATRARAAAEAERAASSASLTVLLGVAPGTAIVWTGDLGATAPLAAPDSSLASAAAADPEAAGLVAAAERGTQLARLARARRWPELEVGPAASLEGPAVIGFNLGITLPMWNRQGAALRAGDAERDAALARLEARRRAVAARVDEARARLSSSDRGLAELRRGELARAAQAESLAAQALAQGGPYLTSWLAARQALLDAQHAELDLEWQAASARLELRSLTGTLAPAPAP